MARVRPIEETTVREQRVEPRFLCSDLVRLLWADEPRGEHDETVVLENISVSGACVQSVVSVGENTRVRMVCGSREFRGYVRSCYWRDDGYFIGITFDADSKWSKAKYHPKHLLDPSQVKPRRNAKPLVMFAGAFAQ